MSRRLRPWDLSVDRLGRPPLEPFDDVEKLAAGTETIFRDVDPELGEQFAFLRSRELLDLANRKGKAPGGYQTTLEDARLPFIFMNAVGLDSDLRTLLHEGGHAFHTLASRGEPLAAYRESPLEFCEVASMSMELLGARRLEAFYNRPRATDRTASCSKGSCSSCPGSPRSTPSSTGSTAIPTTPGTIAGPPGETCSNGSAASSTTRATKKLATIPGIVSFTFSCIRFITSNTASRSSVLCRSGNGRCPIAREPWPTTRRPWRWAALGRLPELFAAAGIRFDFSEQIIGPLMETIRKELEKLSP